MKLVFFKANKVESIKLIEAKRSQQLGIIMSSKHLDTQVVRDSLIGFDSNVLNFETLSSVYETRPTDDELKVIEVIILVILEHSDNIIKMIIAHSILQINAL